MPGGIIDGEDFAAPDINYSGSLDFWLSTANESWVWHALSSPTGADDNLSFVIHGIHELSGHLFAAQFTARCDHLIQIPSRRVGYVGALLCKDTCRLIARHHLQTNIV